MEEKLVERYRPIIDEVAKIYSYDQNIKHLLYLIVPAFVMKYGVSYEKIILEMFRKTPIFVQNNLDEESEAFYTSIPYLENGQVQTKKFIILNKYSNISLVQLLDNLIHEFNHALHSYSKEILIKNQTLYLRTGLSYISYTYPELKNPQKADAYLLEEILNTVDTEEIINYIKTYQTNDLETENTIYAINSETTSRYQSKSYYLEHVIIEHILSNKTFIFTLNRLRLTGDIWDIDSWFDHITGIPGSYQRLNQNLVQIIKLESVLKKKKYFKHRILHNIQTLIKDCFQIIDIFNEIKKV